MRGVTKLALLVTVVLLVTACAEDETAEEPADPDPEAGEPSPEPGDGPDDEAEDDAAPGQETITGVLVGDPDLEGGCVWLETDDGTYEVLWPEGYTADADEIVLRDADGEIVAEDGDELTVTGAEAEDLASICMVGTLFEATEIELGG